MTITCTVLTAIAGLTSTLLSIESCDGNPTKESQGRALGSQPYRPMRSPGNSSNYLGELFSTCEQLGSLGPLFYLFTEIYKCYNYLQVWQYNASLQMQQASQKLWKALDDFPLSPSGRKHPFLQKFLQDHLGLLLLQLWLPCVVGVFILTFVFSSISVSLRRTLSKS